MAAGTSGNSKYLIGRANSRRDGRFARQGFVKAEGLTQPTFAVSICLASFSPSQNALEKKGGHGNVVIADAGRPVVVAGVSDCVVVQGPSDTLVCHKDMLDNLKTLLERVLSAQTPGES